METLNNFADYLWVITKIVFLFLVLGAILLTIIGNILGATLRVKRISREEMEMLEQLENQENSEENEEK